jgi:cyclophilin family peptidyl-prolyl cis-trans isomerase
MGQTSWKGTAIAILICCSAGCGGNRAASEVTIDGAGALVDPLEIIDLAEDRRVFGSALADLASHPAGRIRERLAEALGRIGEPAAAGVLAGLAADGEDKVRTAALFAIGVLGDEAPEPARAAVLARLGADRETAERLVALDAAGRLAREDEAATVAALLADPLPAIRAAAARALGFLGQRGRPVPDGIVTLLSDRLADDDEQVRFMAAFALYRIAEPLPGPPAAVEALREAAGGDSSWEVRAYALRGLARRGGLDARMLERALADEVPAVGATAVSVLGLVGEAPRRCELAGAALALVAERVDSERVRDVDGGLGHAARAVLEAAAGCDSTAAFVADANRIAAAIASGLPGPRTAGASLVLCLARLVAGADDLALLACDPERPHRGKRLLARRWQSRHAVPEAAVAALRPLLADPDLRVALAALDSLAAVPLPAAREAVIVALEDERMPVVAAALDAVAGHAEGFLTGEGAGKVPLDGLLDSVGRAVARFAQFDHTEAVLVSAAGALGALAHPDCAPVLISLAADSRPGVRRAVLTAFEAIAGLEPPAALPPTEPRRPADPAARGRWAAAGTVARVLTTRGTFVVGLRGDVAPATVDSFAELAAEGYFEGTEIHRVVPGFVVQAGDPTGTGLGDPGYTLRCEVSPLPYRRGTVGMALSGKDTGGSQFFVALSAQPHLDGNYTVFGEVGAGMEVLDLIEEGDEILEVKIERRGRARRR